MNYFVNKLSRKSKKLESELKFILVKKYFHYGFRDKTQSMLDMLEEKNENKFGAYQPNGVNVSGVNLNHHSLNF
jgi:hypothetical protein